MKKYTDVTVLLDRSGSMQSIKEGMEEGFKSFVREQRKAPLTRMTLIQFDNENDQEVVFQNTLVTSGEVKLSLIPRGGTPLLDALCKAIDGTGARLAALPEAERPSKVLFVIITDGQENASRRYRRSDVKERVTRQQDHYKWNFVYLGANQDSFSEAFSYGIPLGSTLTYSADNAHTVSAFAQMSRNVSPMFMGEDASFTTAQRNVAATAEDREQEDKKLKKTLTK